MTTSEQKVATVTLPANYDGTFLFLGTGDGTGTRSPNVFVDGNGEVYVQFQDAASSGQAWFTFTKRYTPD
jgi:hypothetical protein